MFQTLLWCVFHIFFHLQTTQQSGFHDFCSLDEEISSEKGSNYPRSHTWKGAKPWLEATSVWLSGPYSFTRPIAVSRIVKWKFRNSQLGFSERPQFRVILKRLVTAGNRDCCFSFCCFFSVELILMIEAAPRVITHCSGIMCQHLRAGQSFTIMASSQGTVRSWTWTFHLRK